MFAQRLLSSLTIDCDLALPRCLFSSSIELCLSIASRGFHFFYQHYYDGMSNRKLIKQYARDIHALQKQFLKDGIEESSNAQAYMKMLERTVQQLNTFNKNSPMTYVNYVARDRLREQKRAENKRLKLEEKREQETLFLPNGEKKARKKQPMTKKPLEPTLPSVIKTSKTSKRNRASKEQEPEVITKKQKKSTK